MPNGHELLSEQLEAVHLGLGAAAAVVAGPLAPKRPAEALDGAQGFVPRCRTGAVLLPRLGVPARRKRALTLQNVRSGVFDRLTLEDRHLDRVDIALQFAGATTKAFVHWRRGFATDCVRTRCNQVIDALEGVSPCVTP
jgi:hypothetical protein